MTFRQAAVVFISSGAFSIVAMAQTTSRSQIEAALDLWSGRASTRNAILRVNHDPVPALTTIAQSKRESESRRVHAIALLATFKIARAERALKKIANDTNPKYRCSALQALAELNSRSVIPVLIGKLDDHFVCMTAVSTDPAEEREVYVSDEAVRLLEQITGQSFGQEGPNGHRGTSPWKEWWAKQERSSKAPRADSPRRRRSS